MELAQVMRSRREAMGLTQSQLADVAGVDKRQIRRYEAGEAQPPLPVAANIAKALHISLDELAGADTQRLDVSGTWWACWQTYKDGEEILNPHLAEIDQRGDEMTIVASTRGTQALEDGGYLWRGAMRLWDNEVLMGWYVATEGAVRSKGVMYFVLHQHGAQATGRWVGTSYDGPVITGLAAMARDEDTVMALMNELREKAAADT
jgi:transcriptional regulator with XRE-family HTH domain